MSELIVVSLIALISNPGEYHDKAIRITGFLSLKYEASSLWSSEEDYGERNTKKSIWVDIKTNETNLMFDGECVVLEGVFNAKMKGHFGMYSGTIEKITQITKSSLCDT